MSEALSTDRILEEAPLDYIYMAPYLTSYYLGIFLSAESAFILMAIKEYLQDIIGLTEMDLIRGGRKEDTASTG